MKNLLLLIICLITFPTFSNVVILNGLTHKYATNSGEVIEGKVVLLNTSAVMQRVVFSLNDAILSCEQTSYFSEKEAHDRSSNSWFSSEVMEIELQPEEKYTYKFKLIVPNNLKLKGSYWSILMVNIEKPIKEQLIQNKIGIQSKIRYAIQLLTDVDTHDEVAMDFVDVKLDENNTGKKSLAVAIQNQGLFIEPTTITLEVYNDLGTKIQTISTIQQNIFPSMCRGFTVDVSLLAPGTYQCIILAQSRDEYTGTNLTLDIQ